MNPVPVGSIGPFSQEQLLFAGIVVLLLVVGAYLVYAGVRNLNRALTIFSSDPIDAGDFHTVDGTVEIQGEAAELDGLTEAKYTGTPCLAYTYEKKRKDRNHGNDSQGTDWDTVDSGSYSIPFYVTDETGQVAVDPDGATLSLDSTRVSGDHRTREYEGRLEPGDTVHVFGEKQQAATKDGSLGDERAYIGEGSGETTFTVSDTTELRTVIRFFLKGLMLLFFALVLFGVLVLLATQNIAQLPELPFGRFLDLTLFVVH